MGNNENHLLTVKEYASSKGITVQAVYKRLNQKQHPFNQFVKKVKGKVYIKQEALNYNGEEEITEETNAEEPKEADNANLRIIELLEKQIAEKDEMIKNLLDKIDNMTTLINQQQQLTIYQTRQLEEKKKKRFLFFKPKEEENI